MLTKGYARRGLTEEVDVDDGEDHEDGHDEKGNLAVFLETATEDDGVETALLETRSTVLAVMMVVVMMMLLLCHVTSGCCKEGM